MKKSCSIYDGSVFLCILFLSSTISIWAADRIIYQEDFSSDPGWITNNPEHYYWDPSSGSYCATSLDASSEFAYILLSRIDPNKGWRLEYEIMPVRCDSIADNRFGFLESDMNITYQPTFFTLNFANVTVPNTVILDIPSGGSYFGNPWLLSTWYHCELTLTPWDKKVTAKIIDLFSGIVLGEITSDYLGDTNPIDRIGMSTVGDDYATGATGIAFFDNIRVTQFDPVSPICESTYLFVKSWGDSGSADVRMNRPSGITTDSQGFVYVADETNNRIQKFDGSGNLIAWLGACDAPEHAGAGHWHQPGTGHNPQVGSGPLQFNNPSGVALDSAGNLYVVENLAPRIQKIGPDGSFIKFWSTNDLCMPNQIAVDNKGFVYVSNPGPCRNSILKFTEEGEFVKEWSASDPVGIAVDTDGSVYISEFSNSRIVKFSGEGELLSTWGEFGSGDNQFDHPTGISINCQGYLFVVDRGGYIKVFSKNGQFITKWGSDGSAPGQFRYATGITLDPDGNLFVADTHNYRVQKFSRPYLRILSPNGNTSFMGGAKDKIKIRWESSGSFSSVKLELLRKKALPIIIADNLADTGEYDWIVPMINSKTCKIQITGIYNDCSVRDISDNPFTIFVCNMKMSGDINGDCYVNLADFAEMAMQWLYCGNPFDPTCAPHKVNMGLVGHWSFDEGEGSILHDSSMNQYDGTINGATWTDGVSGRCLQFDGLDGYGVLDDETMFRLTSGTLTMSFWLKTTQVTHGTILMKNNGWRDETASGWNLFVGGGKIYSVVSAQNSWVDLLSTSTVNDGHWHHIVIQMGDTGRKIYIDGVLDVQDLTMTAVAIWEDDNPTPLSFGAQRRVTWDWWDGLLDGLLDEVRIYDRALTQDEVQFLYQNP